MMTIYFKNGMEQSISQETAEILKKRIIDGCPKFQIFIDQNDKAFLFINVEEIAFIY